MYWTKLVHAHSPTDSQQTQSTNESSLTQPAIELSHTPSLPELSQAQLPTGLNQTQSHPELGQPRSLSKMNHPPSLPESIEMSHTLSLPEPNELSRTPSPPEPNQTQLPTRQTQSHSESGLQVSTGHLHGLNQLQLCTGLNYDQSPSQQTQLTAESSRTQPPTEPNQPQSLIEMSQTHRLPELNPTQSRTRLMMTQTQLHSESGQTQSPTERNKTKLSIEQHTMQSLADTCDQVYDQGNTLADPQLLHSLHQESPPVSTAASIVYLTAPPTQSEIIQILYYIYHNFISNN